MGRRQTVPERQNALTDFLKPSKANKKTKKSPNNPESNNLSQRLAPTASSNDFGPSRKSNASLTKEEVILRRQTRYGNTSALILDYFRAEDGTVDRYRSLATPADANGHHAWLEEKNRRISTYTPILEADDYTVKAPATCQTARVAFAEYAKFPELLKERQFARVYQQPQTSTNTINFLDLPGEIKNQVYRELVVFKEPFELLPKSGSQRRRTPGRALEACQEDYSEKIAILQKLFRVNKQIGKEIRDIFYGDNEFRFTGALGWPWLAGFMHKIGMENAARLRIITVHIHWPGKTWDKSDYWYPRDPSLQTCIDSGNKSLRYLDKYRKPAEAYNECMRIFNRFGSLARLNLVLPYSYEVFNVWDLNLDASKYEHQVKVKLVHLDTNGQQLDPSGQPLEYHLSQRPLLQTKAPRKTIKGQKTAGPSELIQKFASPKAYAKAKEWGYEKKDCDEMGEYENRKPRDDDYDEDDEGQGEGSWLD